MHEEKMINLEDIEMREMMNLMEFVEYVKEEIRYYLPNEEYKDAEITVSEVVKNNDTILYGMSILKSNQNITPTIYLDTYYEEYLRGKSLDSILKHIVSIRNDADIPEKFNTEQVLNLNKCRDKIFPKIINAKLNEKMLHDKPCRYMEDLAVVYFVKVGDLTDGAATITINNELLNTWQITESELDDLAMKNERWNRYTLRSMRNVLKSGIELTEIDWMEDGDILNEEYPFFVLTNKENLNGATALLHSKILNTIAYKFGKFYILPSSVHEIMILPATGDDDIASLKEMVCEINDSVVADDEILSYNVYQFTKENGFEIAK